MEDAEEIWRDIEGYECLYQVSNLGRIRSLDRYVDRYTNHLIKVFRKGRLLESHLDKDGYLLVTLCKNNKVKLCRVHRLVAEAFIPNPNNYPIINHKDEIKDNNCVENLEWCTHKYNLCYGTRLERLSKSRKGKGLGNRGRIGTHHTEEAKRRIGQINKIKMQNRIWINNGTINKRIYSNELDNYLQDGYILGRTFKKQGRKNKPKE